MELEDEEVPSKTGANGSALPSGTEARTSATLGKTVKALKGGGEIVSTPGDTNDFSITFSDSEGSFRKSEQPQIRNTNVSVAKGKVRTLSLFMAAKGLCNHFQPNL